MVVTPAVLREWLLPIPDGGKDARGSVLVVGGSRGAPGAAVLAGLGGLRAGAGRLQLAVPASLATAVGVAVPEAGIRALAETSDGAVAAAAAEEVADACDGIDVVLVGPGLDDPEETGGLLGALLPALPGGTAVVLDALALGCLPGQPAAARAVAGRCLFTPNVAEASRLLEAEVSGESGDAAAEAAAVAVRYGAAVTLRGHIATPDGRAWRDESGHSGLGTSGSGDVLAGLAAGLLARCGDPAQAAVWASYLHSTAGERLAARIGRVGFLARELLDEAPRVLAELHA